MEVVLDRFMHYRLSVMSAEHNGRKERRLPEEFFIVATSLFLEALMNFVTNIIFPQKDC
jgi:hypothetical protein